LNFVWDGRLGGGKTVWYFFDKEICSDLTIRVVMRKKRKDKRTFKRRYFGNKQKHCKTRKLVGRSKASLKECGFYGTSSGSLRLLFFMLAFLGLGIPLKDTCYYRKKKDQK
jgi:hypothetical protein